MTAREQYQLIAEQWDKDGRPVSALKDGYSLLALRCWTYSQGAKAEGISDVIQAFVRASEDAQKDDWLDAYLSDRESCRGCGESYRFENVSICTACRSMYCYRCSGNYGRAPNGNPACQCGKGEVVG